MKSKLAIFVMATALIIFGCEKSDRSDSTVPPVPRELVDLGALVTEDLPERMWGKAFMSRMGFSQNNTFDVRYWEVEFPDGTVSGSNSYFTLFNHGGPHVDAPNHMNLGAGLDNFPIDAFVGPLKVIDVSEFPLGRSVPLATIRQHNIQSGDVVLIYTDYKPPTDDDLPHRIALTREAAEYLATLPVRAFGTDAFNVDSNDNPKPVISDSAVERVGPNHYTFLTRGIPIFEQLFNVDQLLDKESMYFVGQPLNIKDGDGMLVRPVVLVY